MAQLFPMYGSIIKIKTKNNIYDNLLFFVNKIEESYIDLISNNGMELVKLELNEDKSLKDSNIDEIDVIYEPENGYASQNKLLPGKNLLILFNESVPIKELEGEIIDLKEDLIIIELLDKKQIFIDFEYSGLLDKYNIDKVKIKSSDKNKQEFFIDLENTNIEKIKRKKEEKTKYVKDVKEPEIIGYINSEEEEQGPLLIYSIDQQIDDYIEYNFKKKISKKKIKFDIKRYLELVDTYIDL